MHNHSLILLEAGAAIKEVQDRLGHTDVQTTMNIYAHVTKKTKAEAIQKFEKHLNI
ncbi:tyrosine-type recombinase/integrase [Peribacillus asahii]|uniref:tyrosine-type recombinase/integrase n=1 Tax=Peribacillus asahii TaxID=228899 RepID=UPI002579EA93|nr:tyrosine-type recombinase/integrase [Peribacillus asahii]